MSDNKKLKSRRSSILKPPKPRNPLSDVDLNPPTDVTLKSRRVSFANVHFKKEFTADPEKNTIWHNSYEEEMNKSDKSDLSDGKTIQSISDNGEDMNMSVQDMSLDSDVMNCTHLVNLDGSLGHNSSDSSGVIDLTKYNGEEPVLPTIPRESENICSDIKISGKRQTINFIQGSEDANMDMTTVFPVDIFSQNKRKTVLYNQMSEDEQNMEVTEYIPSNLVQNNIITNGQTIHFNKDSALIENSENITSNWNENMPILCNIKIDEHSSGKITPAVQFVKDTDNRRTVYFHSGSMDITEHISSNINQKTLQQSLLPENKPLACKRYTILQHKMNEEEQNMNITENICAQMIAQQKSTVPNKENALSHTVFLNQLQEQNMEITQNICANFVQNNEKSKNRHTIHYNEEEKQSLDITEDISTKIRQNTLPKSQRQTILFKQMQDEEQDMEITQNMFTNFVHNNENTMNLETVHFNDPEIANVDITTSVPRSLIQKINQQGIPIENKENMPSSSHRRTILYNQLENAQNLEITENIPTNILQNNINPKNRQTIHFTNTNMGYMDITENIPVNVLQKMSQKNIPFEDKENVPSLILYHEEESREMTQNVYPSRETIHFNEPEMGNIDITESVPFISIKKQKLPVENKENICGISQIKSISQNEEQKEVVELSERDKENVPSLIFYREGQSREITQNDYPSRETIHFNEPEMGNMEITESVPFISIKKQKLPVENKENICGISQIKSISQNEKQKEVVELSERDKENVPSLIFYREGQSREMTQNDYPSRETIHFNEPEMGNMEITESVPFISIKKQKLPFENKENICGISQIKSISLNEKQKEDVEITESIRRDIQNNRQTIHFDDSDSGAIDITKSVPFSLIQKMSQQKLAVEDKENMHSTSLSKLSYNETQEEENMIVTKNITTNIVQNSQKQKTRQTIHFNESNMGSLNITETVPSNLVQKMIQPVQSEHMQNICTNFVSNSENKESMCNISKIKSVSHNETQKEEERGNIDITESVPFISIKKQKLPVENKENICGISQIKSISLNEKQKEDVEITESIRRDIQNNRQTIHFDDSDSGAIDITKSVPFSLIQKMSQQKLAVEDKENMHSTSHSKLSYNETKEEENMIVTKNITTNIVQNSQKQKTRQTIHFNESNMGSLNITETVPSNLVQKMIQPVQSEHMQNICTNFVSNSENKESMCNISKIKSVSRNETQKEEERGNINITESVPFISTKKQKLPVENKENICGISQIKSISQNENQKEEVVEITESIRGDIQNNIKLKDRQTIHFDDSHSGAIDITRSVPFSLIQKLSQQKLPVEDEENMFSTSHTKLSYNETQEEQNVEVAKNITTNIVQNSEKQKNQQTIHFNESNMESMDVTENAQSNLVQNIIQLVPSEYTLDICTNFISNSENRSTIHYNETQMDNTEVTENVPANLLQKFMQQLPFEDKEEQNECLINVTDALDLTPVNNQPSFNITANLTSLVDSTEKLINCKIGLPTSEYSKIITDNIDKNYSIFNTSIPENLDFSAVTISDNEQKMDSIISVNSSTESVEHMDEWKKMLNKVKPPPEIHYFDVDELLAKLPPPSLDEDIKLLKSWVSCPLSIKERAKKYLNIDLDKYDKMKQEKINFNVPQIQLEEEKPKAVFDRIKKLLENKQQPLEFKQELTLSDKIKRMATKDKLWYLVPNTEFSFIFMKNIRFDVHMETNSEMVQTFCSTLDESKLSPIGLYVFERLKPKLKEEKVKSCIGAHYTIFSFLDYLTQISEGCMDNINDFNDLTCKYGLTVDEDLNATLLFTNLFLPLSFEIKFNLNDLDHISADSIKINQLVCTADENALKRLVKFCPTGVEFIRAYHHSVSEYLKLLQQSKLK